MDKPRPKPRAASFRSCLRRGVFSVFAIAGVALGADGPSFDHSTFDRLLGRHVDENGWVDYAALETEESVLDAYITALAEAPMEGMTRDEELALLINAYNAFTLKLILEHYPLRSILDIPASRRWKDRRWIVGGNLWSLDQIEHEQIRPRFREPRIHFALVCASVGCPILRNEAYAASTLDAQLQEQMLYCHSHERWLRYDTDREVVYLTRLYDWYHGDFEQESDSILGYAARYSPALRRALETGETPAVRFLQYDWSLNDIRLKSDDE